VQQFCNFISKNFDKFIEAGEKNYEIIMAIETLRSLIYFKGEPQKDIQILILLYLKEDFFVKIVANFENEIMEFTTKNHFDK